MSLSKQAVTYQIKNYLNQIVMPISGTKMTEFS